MKSREFVDLVRTRHPDAAITPADVQRWQKYGWLPDTLTEFDVPRALGLYARLYGTESIPTEEHDVRSGLSEKMARGYTHVERVWRERARLELELDGYIQRQVKQFRQDVWNSSDPPFPGNPNRARAWIEAKVAELEDASAQENALLLWRKADGSLGGHRVPRGHQLDRLRFVAELARKLLDCKTADATMYILTGQIPPVQPIKCEVVRGANSAGFLSGAVAIVVRTPDISPEMVKQLYSYARQQAWGTGKTSIPNEKDLELANFYWDTEGLSWEERLNRWNRDHDDPAEKYDYRDALRMACERALKRVVRPPK